MAVEECCYVAIQNVAVATDFSECSERAVLHGAAIARKFGATLHLLNLVQPSKFASLPEMLPEIDKAAGRDCDQFLSRLRNSRKLDGVECRRWVEQGEIFEVVRSFVQRHHIDLLVVGTHGRGGISRLIFGSVSQEIISHVDCPVLTVGPCSQNVDTHIQLKRVLFSTDLSSASLAALRYVLTAVREWHAELDVLHVCSTKDADCPGLIPRRMNDLRSKIDGLQHGFEQLPIRYQQLAGKPAPSIIDFANQSHEDLIVLGLKPHRPLFGTSTMMWHNAYEIVRRAQCPVLTVRAESN